ncbi:MAG: APC family permease [Candidatus Dadabacteria bacterium]|nr:MAG: APC family permease [Candidatus Dadabacteria bacterium]
MSQAVNKQHTRLGEWHSTAICGNDITSSCLYVSALALLWAGPLAPVALIIVAAVLWLFRGIYAEVVGALPLNGGAYNALLNTTSKFKASIAACLTILSYLATSVISASEAVEYGASVVRQLAGTDLPHFQIMLGTVLLLSAFAYLTIRGIGESAQVALAIFIFHMTTLSLLVIFGLYWIFQNGTGVFASNLAQPAPRPSSHPLLFGFAVAMLGISGFESSANFVEEQKPGVFPKTLRNMWAAVSFFNPTICCLALAVIPLTAVEPHKEALLAHLGELTGGSWLGLMVSLDAALVLSGAVLTSFVGVTGLVHRMTLDRCLPQLLLRTGRYGTFYRIIVTFLILSAALVFVAGDLNNLAGVYTISFLSVMALFVYGNVLLKIKRARLPRPTRVSWLTLLIAFTAVATGVICNVILEIKFVQIFLIYFVPALLIVTVMLLRIEILKFAIFVLKAITRKLGIMTRRLTLAMTRKIEEINSQTVVFFTRGSDISNLNEAMLYVRKNEHTNRIKIVTVVDKGSKPPERLAEDLKFLDRVYPEIDIEYVEEHGKFSPELVKELSKKWKIPLNFMFIGAPSDHFPHNLAEFGGVRLIIS